MILEIVKFIDKCDDMWSVETVCDILKHYPPNTYSKSLYHKLPKLAQYDLKSVYQFLDSRII